MTPANDENIAGHIKRLVGLFLDQIAATKDLTPHTGKSKGHCTGFQNENFFWKAILYLIFFERRFRFPTAVQNAINDDGLE